MFAQFCWSWCEQSGSCANGSPCGEAMAAQDLVSPPRAQPRRTSRRLMTTRRSTARSNTRFGMTLARAERAPACARRGRLRWRRRDACSGRRAGATRERRYRNRRSSVGTPTPTVAASPQSPTPQASTLPPTPRIVHAINSQLTPRTLPPDAPRLAPAPASETSPCPSRSSDSSNPRIIPTFAMPLPAFPPTSARALTPIDHPLSQRW